MQTSRFSAAHATMGRNESRVAHLRALRKHAKTCDVDAADIPAGKEKVTEMMANIRASSASAEVKKAAEEAYRGLTRRKSGRE